MEARLKLTTEIWQEGTMFVGYCHELDLSTCGPTIQKARQNIAEVIEVSFAEARRKGQLRELLEEAGFRITDHTVSKESELCALEHLSVPVEI